MNTDHMAPTICWPFKNSVTLWNSVNHDKALNCVYCLVGKTRPQNKPPRILIWIRNANTDFKRADKARINRTQKKSYLFSRKQVKPSFESY